MWLMVRRASRLALIVKAAGRLANLRMSARGGSDSKLEMYRREHPAFRDAAFRPPLCDDLWREMDQVLSPPDGPAGREQPSPWNGPRRV